MDIEIIIKVIIPIIGAVITYLIVPFIKSKTTIEQQKNIEFWVEIAVNAAEQIFGSGLGEKKKQYVIDFLNSKGINITEKELDILIEAAVFEMNNVYLRVD